jgi:hypothetical protein
MKEEELRKHAKCAKCGKGIGHTGLPFFWTLTVSKYGLDIDAIKRNAGLTEFFGGSAALARVMGPDEDMAEKIIKPVTLTLCEKCAMEPIIVSCIARGVMEGVET